MILTLSKYGTMSSDLVIEAIEPGSERTGAAGLIHSFN